MQACLLLLWWRCFLWPAKTEISSATKRNCCGYWLLGSSSVSACPANAQDDICWMSCRQWRCCVRLIGSRSAARRLSPAWLWRGGGGGGGAVVSVGRWGGGGGGRGVA